MPEIAMARLREGLRVDDSRFDRVFPDWARVLSNVHWTPVAVAVRAAELLVRSPGTRVLDVGAGVGKFCLVGSLVTEGVFYGIEACSAFVHAARATAARLQMSGTRFLHGNMMALEWGRFDAFYLYNPFADNLEPVLESHDHPLGVEPCLFDTYVRFASEQLHAARVGTRVATYHGFGGPMPPSYRLEFEGERELEWLELWTKAY
jgi:SAM-dependent methyltransferase